MGGRGPRSMGVAKMPEGGTKVIMRLMRLIFTDFKWSLVAVVVCILITSVTSLVSSLFTKTLIDDYIIPLTETASPDYMPLAHILMILGAVLAVGALSSYIHSRLMINVSQGTLLHLRTQTFEHTQRLPLKYFDSHAHGDIMSVYTNDIDTLRQMISSMPNLLSSVVTIALTLISMIVLSPPLTLLIIIMSGVMIGITRWLGTRSAKHFKEQQQNIGRMNGFIEEMLTGQKIIKTFCHEKEAMTEFHTLNEALRNSANNANKVANIVMPVNGNLSNLIYILAATIGAMLALNVIGGQASPVSVISVGTLVAFLTLIKNFTRPVSEVSQQLNNIINAVAGASRVFQLTDAQPEDDSQATVTLVNAIQENNDNLKETVHRTGTWAWKETLEDGTVILTRQRGEVDFINVDFSYPKQDGSGELDKQVLFDITIDTEAGDKVALVGGTGAGKTTITNLINRFYDIQDGTILYDHIDIKRIHRGALRRSLGMVLQETHLFTGTVMDNIRYGRLDATDEECKDAARLVHADDFICRLPEGYNTMLQGDGGNLSQGERQLIAIARAAVANPPALILDEATSSIDTRTEKLIQQGMDSLMEDRTSFVIAHRLSTIRNARQIIVMDHGHIIEQGTHNELMKAKGKYYELNKT